jgi:hypothetical protein
MGTYRLNDCAGLLPDIYTDSILTPTIDSYEGKVIYTQQYPSTCWEVIKDAAVSPETLGVLFSYDICQDCLDALATQCGCPPGYTYNVVNELCESSTSVCPEGYTYNAETELCEAPAEPCELDLAIVVDRSASINSTELVSYKSFLEAIINGIQDNGNTNRITTDQIRVAIIYFGRTSPITTTSTIGLASIPLEVGSASIWQPASNGGILKASVSAMSTTTESTCTYSGLRAAYQELVSGTNARVGAAKRILFVTDGWPQWHDLNPPVAAGITGTPVTFNGITPDNINYSDAACTALGGVVGNNASPAPLNICHNLTDTTVNTSTLVVNKRKAYTDAMDLAQDIKNGTGVDCTIPIPITLIIVGSDCDRTATKGAFVGTNPTGVGPNDYCYFNVNDWSICTGTTTYKYWDASYEYTDGSGNWLRFPSNNAVGTPDYFETEFTYDSTIIAGIISSLICIETETPAACDSPCVLNETTGECECVSTNYVTCCYDLINCEDGSIYATVNTNNLTYDFLAQYVGSVITFEGLPICLWVETSDNCSNSTPIENLANIQQYATCQECQSINSCYLLTNCNNPEVTLYTYQDLSLVSGNVVELSDYPGLCWTVLKTFNCPGPFTTVAIVNTYEDCECCFQYQCV